LIAASEHDITRCQALLLFSGTGRNSHGTIPRALSASAFELP